MKESQLSQDLEALARQFAGRQWRYLSVPEESPWEKVYAWPGQPEESIMVCVHQGTDIFELFHRQDFFFFNFAYEGSFDALSYNSNHIITVEQGQCYIGQPMTGYALQCHRDKPFTIIGILIQKGSFFRRFLPVLAADSTLFHFFLDPTVEACAQEFIHLEPKQEGCLRRLLELMVLEYAHPTEDTQKILEPLVLSLLMYIAREYHQSQPCQLSCLSEQVVAYMGEHWDTVSLKTLADHFSYHPNYISQLLRKETGRTFSQLLLEQRMEKGEALLRNTDLTVAEISQMLGYTNTSNFHKAFREYFGTTPREFLQKSTTG